MLALRAFSRAALTRRLLITRQFTQTAVMANKKSESEWQAILSPEQFRVLRQKGAKREASFSKLHKSQTTTV